ncbi:MAG: anti-sigma factor family protein [Candidatus Xenobia bacterium]
MKCEECADKLHDYVDRELPDEEHAQISGHLGECPPCQHRFDFSIQFKQAVHRVGMAQVVPGDLMERLRSQLRHTRPLQPLLPSPAEVSYGRRAWSLAGSLVLAACVTVLMLGGAGKPSAASPFFADLVNDHMQCTAELHNPSPISLQAAQQMLSRQMGQTVRLPQVPIASWTPVWAQVCEVENRPVGHLVLERCHHCWSWYVMRPTAVPDQPAATWLVNQSAPYRIDRQNNETLVMYCRNNETYCVVSDEDPETVRDLALQVNY